MLAFTKHYVEIPAVERAFLIMNRAFAGIKEEPGCEPVAFHSMRVGMAGRNVKQQILGYLHDVVEDTQVTMEDLRGYGFSNDILIGVALLTHDPKVATYDEYIKGILAVGDQDVIAVKLNDLMDNIKRDDPIKHTKRYLKHLSAYEKVLKVYENTYGSFPGKIQERNIQG